MPPTNEQLLLNSGSVQIQGPQVQEGIAQTPIYKEGTVSMPSPQAWIGPIDYGFNWYDLGAKAFKVAGDIYKDVLDYGLRRRQQQATQDLTEMQTLSVQKPDPTSTPEQVREFIIGQNSSLNKKARTALINQGLTEEEADAVMQKKADPAKIVMPASDMNSVLQIIRYNDLTSEEFKVNKQKVEENIWETYQANYLDGASKSWGFGENPNITPEQMFRNRQTAIEGLKKASFGKKEKQQLIDTLIRETDSSFTETMKAKLIQDFERNQQEADHRVGLYIDMFTKGEMEFTDFVERVEYIFDEYDIDSKRNEIYLADSQFDTPTEVSKKLRTNNPDLDWKIRSNEVKKLDIKMSLLQKQLLTADSKTVDAILQEQKNIYSQRTQALTSLVSNTRPELLTPQSQKEYDWYRQQTEKLTEAGAQEQVRQIKLNEIKPTLDKVQDIEVAIQQLNTSVNDKTQLANIKKYEEKRKQLEDERKVLIKQIAAIPDDPNRPQDLQRLIDQYKKIADEITQSEVKQARVIEVKPVLDKIQSYETKIQDLQNSIQPTTTPEELQKISDEIKKLENNRLNEVKTIVNLPDDTNRPPEIQSIIDKYKTQYNKIQEENRTKNTNLIINRSVLNLNYRIQKETEEHNQGRNLIGVWQKGNKTNRLPTREEFIKFAQTLDVNLPTTINQPSNFIEAIETNGFSDIIDLLPDTKEGNNGVLNKLNNDQVNDLLRTKSFKRIMRESGIQVNDDGSLVTPNEVQLAIQAELIKAIGSNNAITQSGLDRGLQGHNVKITKEELVRQVNSNMPGMTQDQIYQAAMESWTQQQQSSGSDPNNWAWVKNFESKSFNDFAFQLSNPITQKRFIDIMLTQSQFLNKQEFKTYLRQAFNYVYNEKNGENFDRKKDALNFLSWLSNKIPSGSAQAVLETSKFNSDFLLGEYNKYKQAIDVARSNLTARGLNPGTMSILEVAQSTGMGITSGYVFNKGGTKIYDFIQEVNPTNGDPALRLYASRIGIDNVSIGPDWDTDIAKAIVTSSNAIQGDFITPFILAISILPQDASAELVTDTALQFSDQFGFHLRPTLQISGANGNYSSTTRPIASSDMMGRTSGYSSPLAPPKFDPGAVNFPTIYTGMAGPALGQTADGYRYKKAIPNVKLRSEDGKTSAYLPTDGDYTDIEVSQENLLQTAVAYYPGSMTLDRLKQDPDYPLMMELFKWFDNTSDTRPVQQRLGELIETNQTIKNWVFKYSGDQGKTRDDVSTSRWLWLSKVLSQKELTARPFIEIALNSSAHTPQEILGNPVMETEYAIMKPIEMFDISFAALEGGYKDSLPSQVDEMQPLPNSRGLNLFGPNPSSGESVVIKNRLTGLPLSTNLTSEYGFKVNMAAQKKFDQEWVDQRQNEKWLFVNKDDPNDIKEFTVGNSTSTNPSAPKQFFSYNEKTNSFQIIITTTVVGDYGGVYVSSIKGNYYPVKRLK